MSEELKDFSKENKKDTKFWLPEINKKEMLSTIETVEKDAKTKVELYSGMQTQKDMKDAKAKLNSFVAEADEIRKNTTREIDGFKKYLKNAMDTPLKEVKALSETYKKELDKLEEERKDDKKDKIMNIEGANEYFEMGGEVEAKWLNKGTKIEDIEEQIYHFNEGVRNSKETIENVASSLGLEANDYIPLLKTLLPSEITGQMSRDKKLLDRKSAKEEVEESHPSRTIYEDTNDDVWDSCTFAGTEKNVKAFVAALEKMAPDYHVEMKK